MILKLGTQTITPIITIAGSGSTPTQSKTASPSTTQIQVTPDSGYALSLVTINAVTSAIDSNIKSENIKLGTTILGVAGNITPISATLLVATPSSSAQTFNPSSPYNAFNQVTVNAIPSSYIIPTGTSNITDNGTFDISSYASVSVSVPDHPYAKRYTDNANFTSYTDSTITTIPYGAFAYTLNLSSVSFSAATTIGSYAFAYCYKLRDIYFPNVKTISTYAF